MFRIRTTDTLTIADINPEHAKIYIRDAKDFLILVPGSKLNFYVMVAREILEESDNCVCDLSIVKIASKDLGISHKYFQQIVRNRKILTHEEYLWMFFL